MIARRNFLKAGAILFAGLAVKPQSLLAKTDPKEQRKMQKPVVLSTWNFGLKANEIAWSMLQEKSTAIDAIEAGVRVVESDPEERSVGFGGRPDRDGQGT